MTDVLTVAIERQRELRDEIADLDRFIQLAETLLHNAKTRADGRSRPDAEPRRDLPAPVDTTDAEQAEGDSEDQQDSDDADGSDQSAESPLRKFPWSGMQPTTRRTGTDDADGPTRRNVFRRDMSAAG